MKSNASLPSRPVNQCGAVLVLALLIVAAVTGLAITFASDFQITAARGENRWHGAQAREYLLAGEDVAVVALNDDEDKEKDAPDDIWIKGLPRTEIAGGWIEGFIEDAQGRFNLNSLLGNPSSRSSSAQKWQRYTPQQRRFMRLLQSFEEPSVDVTQAEEITNAVIDWLDKDNNEREFGGAEATYYLEQKLPYRAANQLMKSASELRLVKHMTAALYRAVEPFIVALPEATSININTALPRIMRTVNRQDDLEVLTELDGESMAEERGEQGFDDVAEFLSSSIPTQISQENNDIPAVGLDVKSSYFILKVNVEIGRQRRTTTTLLQRDKGNEGEARVLRRSDNQL